MKKNDNMIEMGATLRTLRVLASAFGLRSYNKRVCGSLRSPKPLRASHTHRTLGDMQKKT